jgi:inner membrane protein YidH
VSEQPPGGQRLDPQHPDYRFSLANERTFLAWVRTALALLAAGVGVVNLPAGFSSSTGRQILGLLLVVLGLVASIGSFVRWRANNRAITTGSPLPASNSTPIIAAGLSVVAIIALVLVISNL